MKRLQQLIAGVALCSLAPLSTAGVYIGAGLYNTAVDEEVENVKFDDDNTTGGLFLGWRPIELVGVEVGYYDFGEIEGEYNTKVEGGAVTFAGLLSFELGPVGLYGKGGIANTDFDVKHPLGDDDDSSISCKFCLCCCAKCRFARQTMVCSRDGPNLQSCEGRVNFWEVIRNDMLFQHSRDF